VDGNSNLAKPFAAGATPSPSDLVFNGVIAALEEGRLATGQRLVEADLCIRWGVGRSAVREALQRLSNDGVVEISRNKGARIREMSVEQALRTLDVTEVLTGLAAAIAARRIADPGAAQIMRGAVERLGTAQGAEDDRPFVQARRGFYSALLQIGQNEELRRVFHTLQVHVLRAQFNITQTHRRLVADYAAIGEAVLAGDPDRADRTARAHVRNVRAVIERKEILQEDRHG